MINMAFQISLLALANETTSPQTTVDPANTRGRHDRTKVSLPSCQVLERPTILFRPLKILIFVLIPAASRSTSASSLLLFSSFVDGIVQWVDSTGVGRDQITLVRYFQ